MSIPDIVSAALCLLSFVGAAICRPKILHPRTFFTLILHKSGAADCRPYRAIMQFDGNWIDVYGFVKRLLQKFN